MALALSIDELLGYTSEERAKWEQWFAAQPAATLSASLQREGRFPTVWRLMDHILLVEKRHTQRLTEEMPLTEKTGVSEADIAGLFAYGRTAREDLTRVVHAITPADAARMIEFTFRDQRVTFSARKLA